MRSLRRRVAVAWLPRRVLAPPLSPTAAAGAAPGAAFPALPELRRAAADDEARLWVRLRAGPLGLGEAEAASRLTRHGANRLPAAGRRAWAPHLWRCWASPFNLLLSAIAVVSWLLGQGAAAAVVLVMVALATGLRFAVEGRSRRAVERLQAMVQAEATVLRPDADGRPRRRVVAPDALVPGDVLHLQTGDRVPADCRLLQASGLLLDQSALSGDAQPREKHPLPDGGASGAPLDWPHLLFMGTAVVGGSATAVVVATGAQTYLGAVAGRVALLHRSPSAFELGVDRVTWLLLRFAVVLMLGVLLLHGALAGGGWPQATLFALAVAVGLIPELLPAIVAATLAHGALRMRGQQLLVKQLAAVQNLGAMQVLCVDKTGTLTRGRMQVQLSCDAAGAADDTALRWGALAASLQGSRSHPLDLALLAPGDDAAAEGTRPSAHVALHERPFDARRRRTALLVQGPSLHAAAPGDTVHLIVKGDPDAVLALCSRQWQGGAEAALDAAGRAAAARRAAGWSAQGLRVLAVAVRAVPFAAGQAAAADTEIYTDTDTDDPARPARHESELTLVGFIVLTDPAKPGAGDALAALVARGVQVKLLTGDDPRVAAALGREIGLPALGVMTGARIDRMGDAQLARVAVHHNLFARLTPLHKERIVRALRSRQQVVGFMGDGVNDAPALHAADIGISMREATPVAREAADVVLLQRDLGVLEQAVIQGRRTHANLLKYLRMALSSNFGNVLSVVLASLFLPFLPMLPLQLLVQNLLYDLSQLAMPFDRVDEELLAVPARLDAAHLGRFMLGFGPVSTVFDLAAFAALWWGFGLAASATPAGVDAGTQAVFHGSWFAWGLLSQTLVVHLIRTPGLPFVHSRPAPLLLAATVLVALLALWLPWGPWGVALGLQAPPAGWLAFVSGMLLAYGLAVTAVKQLYLRRYGWG